MLWRDRKKYTNILSGLLHIINVILGYVPTFLDGAADPNAFDWNQQDESSILDITRDVTPVPCHSHNDYWRRVPLYDALRWGCTGVEADVWLFNNELYVGHNTGALTQNNTFRTMYVDPLVKMLNHKNEVGQFATSYDIKNGVFDTEPARTLVLLVDFKNNGHEIFPVVSQQLTALREKGYLSYYDGNYTIEGAVTVVATGNAPFDLITANSTYRDIFFDAPLDKLQASPSSTQLSSDNVVDIAKRGGGGREGGGGGGQGTVGTNASSIFDATNSYYASVNFGSSIGWIWSGHISDTQLAKIRSQIREARKRGLQARYWSAPKWPIGLRNKVWNMLVEEGVGYLNGDDLKGMATLDWGVRRHWGILGG
ncbi:altered inheritance of mitochondria 6 [Pyrenophora seminiperda CCB06]|uniref:Altered inheritance of mitochondria protein 6 n=1 Tax=Pyrenophora seminiperda CCB06 TaxID=1302712 RepID=A0A3M7M9Y5_9PLEO|nr:altered inheritance of mitochondria 6 [Pyrenophora seminiperda CCB06]